MNNDATLSILTWEAVVGNRHAASTGISKCRVLYLVDIGINRVCQAFGPKDGGFYSPLLGADPEGTSNVHTWRVQKNSDSCCTISYKVRLRWS
jgi:hypothetical protein